MMRSGYLAFVRNGWLSTATIMVMTLALFVMGGLVMVGALAQSVLLSLESKIDVSVYFVPDAQESAILSVKRELESLPDVRAVSYISRDAALAEFRERHKENALIADALNEIGDNPLEAILNIRAKDPTHYGEISSFLADKRYAIVDKINYFENQEVINRLSGVLGAVRGSGIALALFLGCVAILVAFNTIRLAIYTMREEIGIMRLVGATTWFVRGPFLVSGLLYGIIAAAITIIAFFPLAWFLSPRIMALAPQFNLMAYLEHNVIEFSLMMMGVGIVLGVASSFIAIRRYLQV